MRQFLLVTLQIVAFGIYLNAQEIPKIISFDRNQYQADHQNWMITSDCNGLLIVANSSGVLIFNGFNFAISPSAVFSSFPNTLDKSMTILNYIYFEQETLIGK
jgi:hypothetical protein